MYRDVGHKSAAPWTPTQVENLNEHQRQPGAVHYICRSNGCRGLLVAHKTGWQCHDCTKSDEVWEQSIHSDPMPEMEG
jgi:hypothetical protein